jgi:hypothetical protein
MHNEFWSVLGLSAMILCLLILFGLALSSLGEDSPESSDSTDR